MSLRIQAVDPLSATGGTGGSHLLDTSAGSALMGLRAGSRGRLLLPSAELAPAAKAGGLADVVAALAPELGRQGWDVTVVMPRYRGRAPEGLGPSTHWARIQTWQALDEKVGVAIEKHGTHRVAYLDHPLYEPKGDKLYPDDGKAFKRYAGILSLGALQVPDALGEKPPDVLFGQDWHTGVAMSAARLGEMGSPYWGRSTANIFTIHNMAMSGRVPMHEARELGVAGIFMNSETGEFWGDFSPLKLGIRGSDRVVAVSPKYSQEITTPEFGEGLDGFLRAQGHLPVGVLNGVDYDVWDPRKDSKIPARYWHDNFAGKAVCKQALRDYFKLPAPNPDVPVFAVVSRLTEQKGLDIILDHLKPLLRTGAQLVVLGEGQEYLQNRLKEAAAHHPNQVAVKIGFDDKLAHLMEAGGDMFLMPSRFEPCGLNQMYSLRYGTIPIVRATGGLEDTVEDGVTGFKFTDPAEFMVPVLRALDVWNNPERRAAMQRAGMEREFSWAVSAKKYGELFDEARAELRR